MLVYFYLLQHYYAYDALGILNFFSTAGNITSYHSLNFMTFTLPSFMSDKLGYDSI